MPCSFVVMLAGAFSRHFAAFWAIFSASRSKAAVGSGSAPGDKKTHADTE